MRIPAKIKGKSALKAAQSPRASPGEEGGRDPRSQADAGRAGGRKGEGGAESRQGEKKKGNMSARSAFLWGLGGGGEAHPPCPGSEKGNAGGGQREKVKTDPDPLAAGWLLLAPEEAHFLQRGGRTLQKGAPRGLGALLASERKARPLSECTLGGGGLGQRSRPPCVRSEAAFTRAASCT